MEEYKPHTCYMSHDLSLSNSSTLNQQSAASPNVSHSPFPSLITKMVKFFDNLPDSNHVPYTFITAEPHVKDLVRYMRNEDLLLWGGVAAGFPAAHMLWGGYWRIGGYLYFF